MRSRSLVGVVVTQVLWSEPTNQLPEPAHELRVAPFLMLPLRSVTCAKRDDLHLHKQSVGRLDSSTSRPRTPTPVGHVCEDYLKS